MHSTQPHQRLKRGKLPPSSGPDSLEPGRMRVGPRQPTKSTPIDRPVSWDSEQAHLAGYRASTAGVYACGSVEVWKRGPGVTAFLTVLD